jgi:hypothetical protein
VTLNSPKLYGITTTPLLDNSAVVLHAYSRSVDAPVNTDTGAPVYRPFFLTTITGFFSRKLPVVFGNSEILEFQDLTEK